MELCLPAGYRVYSLIIGLLGVSANGLLMFLIVKSKTASEMRVFNHMLLYRSCVEISEVVVMWVLEPHTELRSVGFTLLFNGSIGRMSPVALIVSTGIYVMCVCTQFINTALLFVHRYVSVRSVHQQNYTLLFAVAGVDFFLLLLLLMFMIQFVLNSLPQTLRAGQAICVGREIILATTSDLMSIRIVLLSAYMAFCIVSNLVLMIWCGYASSAYVKKSTYISAKTVALHRQLFFVLVLEAILPLTLVAIPILTILAILVTNPTGYILKVVTEILTCALVLMPTISPVIPIYFVKPYRCCLIYRLRKIRPRRMRVLDVANSAGKA